VSFSFLATDAGFAASFSAVSTILAVYLGHLLRGRVNLITFSPNTTFFQLKSEDPKVPTVHVRAGQVVVQNLGRRSAKNVQVTSVPGVPPAGYVVLPSIVHSTRLGPNNEWILEIPFVAPKEVVTIQILNGPNIDSVRCEEGAARIVPVIHQRLFPTWVQALVVFLMLSGLVGIFYLVGWLLAQIR
jgi:hypothetical protein